MAKSFQYKVLQIRVTWDGGYGDLEDDLNRLGSRGWEVVAWYRSAVILKKEGQPENLGY
jgi:hypothetical protein